MSSPQEPHRPVPPQPGHEPPAQQPPLPPYGAPGQYGTPPGAPQQPPKKSRKALWTVLGIVGGVLLLVAVGVVILLNIVGGATNQARGLADGFTKMIIAGDTDAAYGKYLDPALMEKLSKEDFAAGIQGLELDGSCKPNYSDLKVSSSNGINGADVAGSIDCDGKKVELAYRFEGKDELKMVNIRLKPQG